MIGRITNQFQFNPASQRVAAPKQKEVETPRSWRDDLADIGKQLQAREDLGLGPLSGSYHAELAEKILADESPTEDLKVIADRTLAKAGLRLGASPQLEAEVAKITGPAKPDSDKIADLRHLPMVSVDNGDLNPATGKLENESKDIDQLAYAERLPNGDIRVMVAIADVDCLAPKGSEVDKHAMHNSRTVYTDDKIYPMIPQRLSEDFTSLNADEDRLAMIKEYTVSEDGVVSDKKLYQGYVHNHAKMAYDSVNEWLTDGDGAKPPQLERAPIAEQIQLQDEAAQRIKGFFYGKGSLEIESGETRAFIEGDKVKDIKREKQTRSKDLVKFLMMGANVATVTTLEDKGYASLRRIVKTPERWDSIVALAKEYDYELPGSANAGALNKFLEYHKELDPKGHIALCSEVVRKVGRGEYVVSTPGEPVEGHFCLALPDYGHSTAPNRRGPDLVLQRIEKAAANGQPNPYSDEELEQLAQHFNKQEKEVNDSERRVHRSAQAKMMRSEVGNTYEGRVFVLGDRKFVSLDEPPVSGVLKNPGAGIEKGDAVQVKLEEVNIEKGWLDFSQVGRSDNGFFLAG